MRKVSKIIEYHGHFSIFKSKWQHENTYIRASEVAELMKTDKWKCWTDQKWDNKGRQKYVYVSKEKVEFVETKSNAYYSESDMFKKKTDWIYVDCFEDWNVDHMGGPHLK